MQEHEIRVVNEKEQLDDKISKLSEFMHSPKYVALPSVEQGLLMLQLSQMQSYSATLFRRIELFN